MRCGHVNILSNEKILWNCQARNILRMRKGFPTAFPVFRHGVNAHSDANVRETSFENLHFGMSSHFVLDEKLIR